jgi:hypothetical protein
MTSERSSDHGGFAAMTWSLCDHHHEEIQHCQSKIRKICLVSFRAKRLVLCVLIPLIVVCTIVKKNKGLSFVRGRASASITMEEIRLIK